MLKYYNNKIHSRRSWNVLCLVWYLSDINRKISLSNNGKKSLNIYANIPPYIFHFEYLFMFTYHISRSQCKSGMNARRAFIHLRIQENCPNYTIFLTTVNSNLSDVTKDVSVCMCGGVLSNVFNVVGSQVIVSPVVQSNDPGCNVGSLN